jgi:hypothetical protein
MENKNFTIVSQDSVPANEPVMPTVWQMKQKKDNHQTSEKVEGKTQH